MTQQKWCLPLTLMATGGPMVQGRNPFHELFSGFQMHIDKHTSTHPHTYGYNYKRIGLREIKYSSEDVLLAFII